MTVETDVLSPCALGGILNRESIPKLRCELVVGAANNQLDTDSDANLLAERGILWAPDFVINAGGIINISTELEPEGYSAQRAEHLVSGIGTTLRAIFDQADSQGITPLAAANALAEQRLQDAARLREMSTA
jgi:leucine dehydrogenase